MFIDNIVMALKIHDKEHELSLINSKICLNPQN